MHQYKLHLRKRDFYHDLSLNKSGNSRNNATVVVAEDVHDALPHHLVSALLKLANHLVKVGAVRVGRRYTDCLVEYQVLVVDWLRLQSGSLGLIVGPRVTEPRILFPLVNELD